MPVPAEVSAALEKVPADEFARQHGWRESAVVHRIKAGIYEGVKEGGTWYVLRPAPSGAHAAEPPEHPPLVLPWPTAPFPLRWVGPITLVGLALCAAPFITGRGEELAWLAGAGLIAITAARLYEGLATGTIRAQFTPPP